LTLRRSQYVGEPRGFGLADEQQMQARQRLSALELCTAMDRPCTVRPATTRSSSAATPSAPRTPIENGLSARANAAAGHSTNRRTCTGTRP
jgi:hypothetical protein